MTKSFVEWLAGPALSIATLLLSGCMSVDIQGLPLCRGELWSESTLYLGRTMNGVPISDQSWKAFVESDVTPRFPDGFTMLHGQGAWRRQGSEETGYETSTLLIILHPDTDQDRRKISDVAEAWRTTFSQEAVLRARGNVCVDFITE